MIGLGSNRLTVCRRGGMSVTQAGRGGMEWLAGGRMPDWITPYSAQATAALKAQFPTQWPTIRDYGFAHPEYCNAISLFAVTDPDIMYSLIPTLGKKRYLVGNGTAWIRTAIKPDNQTEIGISFYKIGSTDTHLMGSRQSWEDQYRDKRFNLLYIGDQYIRLDTPSQLLQVPPAPVNAEYDVSMTVQKSTVNGTEYSNGTQQLVSDTLPIFLFTCNNGGDPHTQISMDKVKSAYIKKNGNELVKFIPCLYGGQRGMADLIGAEFYGDATGNNGFTISESPS